MSSIIYTLFHNIEHALIITIFVFVMMVFVDYFNVLTQGWLSKVVKGGLIRQYIIASALGSIPGCLGAFTNVSFYVHGILSFGALAGGMIATCGDAAFIMLAEFPSKALLLFGILFIVGALSAWVIDKLIITLKIKPCQKCELSNIHLKVDECKCLSLKEVFENLKNITFTRFLLLFLTILSIYFVLSNGFDEHHWDWKRITLASLLSIAFFIILTVPEHYLNDHIWSHIVKRHLWKVLIWSITILIVVEFILKFWNIKEFVQTHILWVILIASLVSLIPGLAPHLIFVMMFAKGLIPFSVLLTCSIIQDGHGIIPLLSYTVRDAVLIKLFNLVIGLLIGGVLFYLGY